MSKALVQSAQFDWQTLPLTLARTIIGFIFKIRYCFNNWSLSVGLVSKNMHTMVSAGSRFDGPFGVLALFLQRVWDGNWVKSNVWKSRVCGEKVITMDHHLQKKTVHQTNNRIIAATNKETCLAGVPIGAACT